MNKTILFVEDDPFLLNMYADAFKKETEFNIAVLEKAGKNFVEKVLKIKPNLISLDIVMPEIDGFEAIKLLKDDSRTKDIPVFFLTNMGLEQDIKRGLKLGAVDYIIKAKHSTLKVVQIYSKFLENPNGYKRRCGDIYPNGFAFE